jgi:ribonuclease Z
MVEAYIQRIIAHHTTPREAGLVFRQTRPKLAVYTHVVMLSSEKVPASQIGEIVSETRQTYDGPLLVGEDLMSFEIGETITVRRHSPATGSR